MQIRGSDAGFRPAESPFWGSRPWTRFDQHGSLLRFILMLRALAPSLMQGRTRKSNPCGEGGVASEDGGCSNSVRNLQDVHAGLKWKKWI